MTASADATLRGSADRKDSPASDDTEVWEAWIRCRLKGMALPPRDRSTEA